MADIIDFNRKKEEQEVEELSRDLDDADGITSELLAEIEDLFHEYGMTERDEVIAKDYFYVMEAIRSFVYGYMKIEHPFHNVIAKMVSADYDEESDTYIVYWTHQKKILDSTEDLD